MLLLQMRGLVPAGEEHLRAGEVHQGPCAALQEGASCKELHSNPFCLIFTVAIPRATQKGAPPAGVSSTTTAFSGGVQHLACRGVLCATARTTVIVHVMCAAAELSCVQATCSSAALC